MKKLRVKKLKMRRETVRALIDGELATAAAGNATNCNFTEALSGCRPPLAAVARDE